MKLINYLEKG